MKYCINCGTKQNDDAAFCSSCGTNLYGLEKFNSPKAEMQSDSSLTKNIVLVSLCVLLLLFSTIIGNIGGFIGLGNCALWLFVSGILLFFAIRPSIDHVDTAKMNLLKTIEGAGVAAVCLIFSFFTYSFIGFLYQVFILFFALMTILKIKKIDMQSRNTTEKIMLALSIVLCVISGIASFGFFISIFA